MKTLKRDPFGNRAVKSPTIPGKYNDSFFFLLYSGPLFVSTFSMGKWHYRLDGWKKGLRKPWVFENLDPISENRLSVPKMMFEIFSGALLLNKESGFSTRDCSVGVWHLSYYQSLPLKSMYV